MSAEIPKYVIMFNDDPHALQKDVYDLLAEVKARAVGAFFVDAKLGMYLQVVERDTTFAENEIPVFPEVPQDPLHQVFNRISESLDGFLQTISRFDSAVWDRYYGRGLATEYARSVAKDLEQARKELTAVKTSLQVAENIIAAWKQAFLNAEKKAAILFNALEKERNQGAGTLQPAESLGGVSTSTGSATSGEPEIPSDFEQTEGPIKT